MRAVDAVIVGGGPAGSSCAWALVRAGLQVVVVDKAAFPRDKVCAGWVTPAVLTSLAIDLEEYRRGRVLQAISAFRTGRIGGPTIDTAFDRPVSYGIRRCEFDEYLLRRSGATLRLGEALPFERRARHWVVGEEIAAPVLIGAGGHFCPVAKWLNPEHASAGPVVAAREIEFRLSDAGRARCRVPPERPVLHLCGDLRGYGWCFRKGDYLNVGLGRQDPRELPRHVRDYVGWLSATGEIPPQLPEAWRGHAYLLLGSSPRTILGDGVLLVGDAAGLAYPRSGEGIRTAVESGLLAASTVAAAGGDGSIDGLRPYVARLGARLRRPEEPQAPNGRWLHTLAERLAPLMLGSRVFTRRVLLERWFLHAHQAPLPVPSTDRLAA